MITKQQLLKRLKEVNPELDDDDISIFKMFINDFYNFYLKSPYSTMMDLTTVTLMFLSYVAGAVDEKNKGESLC